MGSNPDPPLVQQRWDAVPPSSELFDGNGREQREGTCPCSWEVQQQLKSHGRSIAMGREFSGNQLQPTAGAVGRGRDAVPPSPVLSNGGDGSREGERVLEKAGTVKHAMEKMAY